jgi:hypothetical protein
LNYNPLHASPPHFAFVPNHFRIVFAYEACPTNSANNTAPPSHSRTLLLYLCPVCSNPEQSETDLAFVIDELERAMENITLEEAQAAVAALATKNA